MQLLQQSMAGTLQMAAGKKITDDCGTAVVSGDKIDADSNRTPTLVLQQIQQTVQTTQS